MNQFTSHKLHTKFLRIDSFVDRLFHAAATFLANTIVQWCWFSLFFIFVSEYLMTGSPRTAGYPARSPINQDAPNQHRYAFVFISVFILNRCNWAIWLDVRFNRKSFIFSCSNNFIHLSLKMLINETQRWSLPFSKKFFFYFKIW